MVCKKIKFAKLNSGRSCLSQDIENKSKKLEAKKKEAAKIRAEKKKQKEIEKAKRILEEAGELG